MSRARIEKLNTLLSRVRERRAEARLVQLPGASALTSANTNLAEPDRPLLSEAPRPASSTDAQPEAAASPRRTSSIQPAVTEADAVAQRSEPPVHLKTPTSTVPPPSLPAEPASAHDAAQRPSVEVIPPAPQRIAPSSALPFDAAVKVVSSPRIEAPKTFGDLLEQSLALRPK